jgi:hypothetical protein
LANDCGGKKGISTSKTKKFAEGEWNFVIMICGFFSEFADKRITAKEN